MVENCPENVLKSERFYVLKTEYYIRQWRQMSNRGRRPNAGSLPRASRRPGRVDGPGPILRTSVRHRTAVISVAVFIADCRRRLVRQPFSLLRRAFRDGGRGSAVSAGERGALIG